MGKFKNYIKTFNDCFEVSYPSSFSEIKQSYLLKEDVIHGYEHGGDVETQPNPKLDDIHNDPDIKPKNITAEQRKEIHEYTTSGHRYNAQLRNDPTSKEHPHIKTLSSMFNDKDNTNRKHVTTYAGVPSEAIKGVKKNQKVKFKGFVSTSSNEGTAAHFARMSAYSRKDDYKDRASSKKGNIHHIIKFYVGKHHAVSIAHHSDTSHQENEFLLNHGTEGVYLGKDTHKDKNNDVYHIHHIFLHDKE